MKLDVNVDMDGVPALLDRLRGNVGAKAGVREAAEYLRKKAAEPAPVRRQKQPFKTDKQRRYVMMAIRKGLIIMPYSRTGALGKGWRKEIRDNDMTAVVFNNSPAAVWVHHPRRQARYHRGNWETVEEIRRAHEGQVRHIIRTRVIASLKR